MFNKYKFLGRNKKKSGFTILELMVVLSIITFILSSVLSVITVARRNARDAKRKADGHQLEIAIEGYYFDNGIFPIAQNFTSGLTCDGVPQNLWNTTTLIVALVPTYLAKLPRDPLRPSNIYPSFPYDYQYVCLTGTTPNEYGLLITYGNDINKPTCKIVYPPGSTLLSTFPSCN